MSAPFPTHTRPGRRGLPAEVIAGIHADYLATRSLAATGRKWGRAPGTIKWLLERRGLVESDPVRAKRLAGRTRGKHGCFARAKPATAAEIKAMIAKLTRMQIPPGLKQEWRAWSHAQRSDVIRKLWKKFPRQRPTGRFSANLTPFDYTTPLAHELAAKANAGHNSQTAPVKLKAASEGVIWRGRLYFWTRGKGDSYFPGPYDPLHGRPPLHHLVWEAHHGQPVPDKTTVIHLDGNKNNLAPENLALRTMAECAKLNSVGCRLKRDPRNPKLLALQEGITGACIRGRQERSRRLTGRLLSEFTSNTTNENDIQLTHLVRPA